MLILIYFELLYLFKAKIFLIYGNIQKSGVERSANYGGNFRVSTPCSSKKRHVIFEICDVELS